MHRILWGTLLTCAATALSTSPSYAQSANAGGQSETANELQEVTVTGSRVITNGNDSPTPVTVVTADDLQTTHPAAVFNSLTDLPAFSGSLGDQAKPGGAGGGNNSQINALSLNGLGAIRTLILFDGHRVPGTEENGLVDVNTIPQMLLQRVDVVTGGASAVYGSDAVGGVVNFITDRNFNGAKFDARGGISGDHDNGQYEVGAAFGTNLFDGRGHFEGSFQTIADAGLTHDQRSEFQQRVTIQGNGSATYPYFLTANTTSNFWTFGGLITGPAKNPLAGMMFTAGGVLVPFVHGSTAGYAPGSSNETGGEGAYEQNPSVVPLTSTNQLFGRFDFDVSDNLHSYLVVSATYDHDYNSFGDSGLQNITLSASNPFLAPAYQQAMAAAGITSFTFGRKFPLGSPISVSSNDFFTHALYVNPGLEGKFGDYKWELSYVRSESDQETRSNWTPNYGRAYAALDAVTNPANGQIVCHVTLTNPTLYPGCVPIDVFGPGSESAAAANWIRQIGLAYSEMVTHDVSGTLSGAPFNDWAGPVNVALSAEWRTQGFHMTSNDPPVNYAPLSCTGLVYNCTPVGATNVGVPEYAGGTAARPLVTSTVSEAALEADVPLLKDVPFAHSVMLNLAYRYAGYRDNGNPNINAANITTRFSADTWKMGLDWHINDAVTLRATRSRDIRAPTLADLYQTNTTTFNSALSTVDLLTGSNSTPSGASPATVSGGNPNLKPEVANTTTAGLIFQPTTNFSASLDFFNIAISDDITTVNGSSPTIQEGCYAGYAYYCTLQQRPGPLTDTSKANAVTVWYNQGVNISEMKTYGTDFETNYKTDIASHPVSLRALVTWQPHVLFSQPGTATLDYAGAYGIGSSSAQVRATVYAHYAVSDDFGLDWMTRWRSSEHLYPSSAVYVNSNTNVKSVAFSNLTLTYRMNVPHLSDANVYLNIDNVFNTAAPVAAIYSDSTQPGFYDGWVQGDDPVGVYFNLGVRFRL